MRVSTASQIMMLQVDDPAARLPEVEHSLTNLGYRLTPLHGGAGRDDDLPKDLGHLTPGYKRALWTVVFLNVGFGLVEMAGGFLSGSRALKAGALDFLGDGLVTFLGLLAIEGSLRWRARSALLQGLFLGGLGLTVLATTGYSLLNQQQPEAELMGLLGILVLAMNVAGAVVLIPHRTGDANARAVWLFSRNDAIGNAAVVVAAVLVAGLFLHSSWSIVRDARVDLREA